MFPAPMAQSQLAPALRATCPAVVAVAARVAVENAGHSAHLRGHAECARRLNELKLSGPKTEDK